MCLLVFALCSLLLSSSLDASRSQVIDAECAYDKAHLENNEEYFKSIGCEYVIVDVFAYNKLAFNFLYVSEREPNRHA